MSWRRRIWSRNGCVRKPPRHHHPSIYCTIGQRRASSSYIVVGNGPIGASVAKHLVELHQSVTVVDGRSDGMRSSHADRARLIRTFDAEGDPRWTKWNQESLRAFSSIERHSNQSFFTNCGGLLLGSGDFCERSLQAADETNSSNLERLSPHDMTTKWPFLHAGNSSHGLWDPSGGIIDPLAFVRAQNLCASRAETPLHIVDGVATKIRSGGRVELVSGETLVATKKVIVCGGAYSSPLVGSSSSSSTSNTASSLRASKRTVALLEVSPHIATGILKDMPTIKYAFGVSDDDDDDNSSSSRDQSTVEAGSVYVLPPVLYPERGHKWFVKIGGGPNDFFGEPRTNSDLDEWLSSDGDPECAHRLESILRSLLPAIPFSNETAESMACVTTIDTNSGGSNGVVIHDDSSVVDDLVVVSACQGKGAGPADAVARDIVQQILSSTV